jgi:two-component system, OmpR family, alkaline phosphatase synthesis response regulator PhoP
MLKALVVDDDPDIRLLMGHMLIKLDYAVVKAATGVECERLAFEHQPDLILMDFDMPAQNGCETCRNLRQKGYSGQIIIMSALSKVIGTLESLAVGADGFLSKPMTSDHLRECITLCASKVAASSAKK